MFLMQRILSNLFQVLFIDLTSARFAFFLLIAIFFALKIDYTLDPLWCVSNVCLSKNGVDHLSLSHILLFLDGLNANFFAFHTSLFKNLADNIWIFLLGSIGQLR